MKPLTVEFSERDEKDLVTFKKAIGRSVPSSNGSFKERRVELPPISEHHADVRKALESGERIVSATKVQLPEELLEAAKASFIASGGNVSEVAVLHDLTPEAVVKLAAQHEWPVYGGGVTGDTKVSVGQLRSLQAKLWARIEKVLDSLDIEKKAKSDIVQHRIESKYVEPLASRNSLFKNLMDQYMRVGTLLEPEVFDSDPDPSNWHAGKGRDKSLDSVNRELENFVANVAVNIADRLQEDKKKKPIVLDVEAS